MLRYLSALNSFGDSGRSGFGASWAIGAAVSRTAAAAAADKVLKKDMRRSLAYGSDARGGLCGGTIPECVHDVEQDRAADGEHRGQRERKRGPAVEKVANREER